MYGRPVQKTCTEESESDYNYTTLNGFVNDWNCTKVLPWSKNQTRKKWKKMNDSVTALKKKQPYTIEAHECISYQLLLPYKRVWSLSFTTEFCSYRKHWKTNFFHKVASYFKMKKMYYTLCAEQSVISLTML